jgi:hypothetical protein
MYDQSDGESVRYPPMEHAETIVMLARQRSGTNALRDVLDSHADIYCLPEIFQSQPSPKAHLEVETSYFNFLDEHRPRVKEIFTSAEAQERFFLEYMEFLRSFASKRYMLVDIKYNSAHNVDGPWRDISGEPTLFEYIRQNGMRVLHLTRKNYLRFYLSWVKTNLTGKYHLHASGALASPRVEEGLTVDIEDLLFRLGLCQSEDRLVIRNLGGYDRYLAIEYEELFPRIGGPPSGEVLGHIAEWLGIADDFPKTEPRYRKMSALPLSKAITNYEEVAAALRGTELEYVLEDERPYRVPDAV